ncbi:hypothetical protein DFS33DRAFT_1274469 [Desarmillaria ectypa]|nr:hypothetical protein DFS33DRAFT_1274469 [Desarmillaria ectypa]
MSSHFEASSWNSPMWSPEKRGVATGSAFSRSGIGGGVSSLIVRKLLSTVGFRRTMRIYSSMHASEFVPVRRKKRYDGCLNVWMDDSTASLSLASLAIFTTYTRQLVPSIGKGSVLALTPLIMMKFSAGIGHTIFNIFFSSFFCGDLF